MSGRQSGKNLTKAERAQLTARAVELSARGVPNTEIARTLGVHRNTIKHLLDGAPELMGLSAEDKETLRTLVLVSLLEVKRISWEMLTATDDKGEKVVKPTSPNIGPLLQIIGNQDDKIVKLFGLAEPSGRNVAAKRRLSRQNH